MHVVYDTLRQLGAADRPVITLFNKQDKLGVGRQLSGFSGGIFNSGFGKTGEGLAELKGASRDRTKRTDLCGAFV